MIVIILRLVSNFDGCLLDKLIFNGDYYITSSMVYSV